MTTLYLEELFKEPTELAYAAWWAFFTLVIYLNTKSSLFISISIILHNGIIVLETIGLEGMCIAWIRPTYIIPSLTLN